MQQRGLNTIMDKNDNNNNRDQSNPPIQRERHNLKLKVLVRSHAMRESTSPPREPSPNNESCPSLSCIELTESTDLSCSSIETISSTTKTTTTTTTITTLTNTPLLLLSPSTNNSNTSSPFQNHSPPLCTSPTSTLVPSPLSNSRNSPQQCASPQNVCDNYNKNDKATIVNMPQQQQQQHSPKNSTHNDKVNTSNVVEKICRKESYNTSHFNNNKKRNCDCHTTYNCNCVKSQERNNNSNNNINNNNNIGNNNNNNIVSNLNNNTLTIGRNYYTKGKLRQQSSSQGSFEGSSTSNSSLSRGSSSEQYTDTTGINLELFFSETINRSIKDRSFILRIEQDLVNLAKDTKRTFFKFPPMPSYQRMLIHRCAAYFGMDHNLEMSSKCVIVNKTENTRIPEIEFKEHIKNDLILNNNDHNNDIIDEPKRLILKRDSNSIEEYSFKSSNRHLHMDNRRSKSFEEREEEYEKIRKRIFDREKLRQMSDGRSQNDYIWTDIPWSSDNDCPSRYKLQLPDHRRHCGKLVKVQSEETSDTFRPCVAKSYSFGGYGGTLNRGDSFINSSHNTGPRVLTKQDSAASSMSWRLSPSSSGYKSQSQMSESVTPSPSSTPHPNNEQIPTTIQNDQNINFIETQDNNDSSHVLWAITDLQNVPKGSIIINPNTGEPYKNDDGSFYQYDPNNAPPFLINTTGVEAEGTTTISSTAVKQCKSPKIKEINQNQSPSKKLSQNNNNNNNSNINTSNNNTSNNNNNNSNSHTSNNNNKLSLTNSATSPILPYSFSTVTPPSQPSSIPPPSIHNRNFQYVPDNLLQQQAFPIYGSTYSTPTAAVAAPAPPPQSHEVYQQPCILYTTPYGVPVSPQFDGRMEFPSQVTDFGGTYYMNIPETVTQTAPITYQQAPYWNQQPISYYQNPPPATPPTQTPQTAVLPSQRYTTIPYQTTGQNTFLPATYSSNYLQTATTTNLTPSTQHQNVTHPTQNIDFLPIYQPHQIIYSTNPTHSNPAIIYTNQPVNATASTAGPPSLPPPQPQAPNIAFTANPIYTTNPTIYQSSTHYPQNASTSNSFSTHSSNGPPPPPVIDTTNQQNCYQLSQNMAQLCLNPSPVSLASVQNYHLQQQQQQQQQQQHSNNNNNKSDNRHQQKTAISTSTPKGNKFSNPKPFIMGSSQSSSTGTNSPATTVVAAGYPSVQPQQNSMIYNRTPTETPPNRYHINNNNNNNFVPNYSTQPIFYRQISNPGSSRSPTPANDGQMTHFNEQRLPIRATIYHGLPYMLPPDPRIRNQVNHHYRFPLSNRQHFNNQQGPTEYNRSHKNRKFKNNKISNNSPSTNGKPM